MNEVYKIDPFCKNCSFARSTPIAIASSGAFTQDIICDGFVYQYLEKDNEHIYICTSLALNRRIATETAGVPALQTEFPYTNIFCNYLTARICKLLGYKQHEGTF